MSSQQKRKLDQAVSTEIVPVVVPSEPLPPSSNDIIKTRLVTMAVGVLFFLVVVVLCFAIFGHWNLMLSATRSLVAVLVDTVAMILRSAGFAIAVIPLWFIWSRWRKQCMEEKERDTELHLRRTRLLPDEAGNYPHMWDEDEKRTIVTPSGQYIPNVPEHLTWSPRSDYRDTSTRVQEVPSEIPPPPPPLPIPTFRRLCCKNS